jgi:hypothetical protein
LRYFVVQSLRRSRPVFPQARIILQQRLSKVAWAKEVDKMVKWGAFVEPADQDRFVDYLSANFPADKPAEPAVRTAAEKKK